MGKVCSLERLEIISSIGNDEYEHEDAQFDRSHELRVVPSQWLMITTRDNKRRSEHGNMLSLRRKARVEKMLSACGEEGGGRDRRWLFVKENMARKVETSTWVPNRLFTITDISWARIIWSKQSDVMISKAFLRRRRSETGIGKRMDMNSQRLISWKTDCF
uniref:DUF4283 domain-containing protein n=1 Tax=Caenorhabditis tropicalis TaxID=1561998 RepID=A0A1I7US89_9PELO